MREDNLKNTVFRSLIWKFLEKSGVQLSQIIISVILARLLSPQDYGLIAIIIIFINLANTFIDSGFGTALIQKKEVDEIDYSSVFYLGILIATLLYIILYFMSPLIADFYNNEKIIPVLRVLSLMLFVGSINSVQLAYTSRNMQFKKYFICSISASVISGIIGVIFALNGCGVWALVIQQLSNSLLISLFSWFIIKWRPVLKFSLKRLKIMFSYGYKLLFSGLLDRGYTSFYGLLIGKIYNSKILGYYNQGQQIPHAISSNLTNTLSSVLLPTFSKQQDDKEKMKQILRRTIKVGCFVVFPIMIGISAISKPLVQILLTDKWLPSVPFLQLLCLSNMFYPIHSANLQAINAMGRSDIFLKLEIIKKTIGIAILIISIPFGIHAMIALMILTSCVSTAINAFPNRKMLNYSFKEQSEDIVPPLILSLIMGGIVYPMQLINTNDILVLIIQVIVGIIVYILGAYIFKFSSFNFLINVVKSNFKCKLFAKNKRKNA